jgi:hypothetical protein
MCHLEVFKATMCRAHINKCLHTNIVLVPNYIGKILVQLEHIPVSQLRVRPRQVWVYTL